MSVHPAFARRVARHRQGRAIRPNRPREDAPGWPPKYRCPKCYRKCGGIVVLYSGRIRSEDCPDLAQLWRHRHRPAAAAIGG